MTDSAQPPYDPDTSYPPRDERVALERKISLKFKEFRGFVTEFSDNLSLGGMFIRTTTPAPIGTVFDFEFSLDEGEPLIHGIGQVIWVRERDQGFDHPAGIGVRFLFVDPEGRQLIERLVADRLAGGAPITEIELGPPPPRPIPLSPPPAAPGSEVLPRLGALDTPDPLTNQALPWSLEAPPLEPSTGTIGPLMPGPRASRGRGGAARSEPPRRGPWKLLVTILGSLVGVGALVALGWYGASLFGLVGPTEPEKVPLKVVPIPGPADEARPAAPANPPPETAPTTPPPAQPSAATAPAEPPPETSATRIEPVEPMPADAAPEPAEPPPAAPEPGRGGKRERHFKRIEAITWEKRADGVDVILTADGKVEEWDYTVLHLTDPPRELVKIENVERGFDQNVLEVGSRDLPRIRIGFHDTPGGNELHVVLDLATPSVRVEHTDAQGREIRLRLVGPR